MVDGVTLRKENGYNSTNGATKRDIKANHQIHQERIKTSKSGQKNARNETKASTETKKTQKMTTQTKRLTKRSGQGRKTTRPATSTTEATGNNTKVGRPTLIPTHSSSKLSGAEGAKQDERRKYVDVKTKEDRRRKNEGKREKEVGKKGEEVIGVKGTMEELLVSSFECLSTSDSMVEVNKTDAGVVFRKTYTSETHMSMEYSYSKTPIANDDVDTFTLLDQPEEAQSDEAVTAEVNLEKNDILMIENGQPEISENLDESPLMEIADLASRNPEKDSHKDAQTNAAAAQEQMIEDEDMEKSTDSLKNTNDAKEKVSTLAAGEKLSSVPLRMRQNMSKKDRNARCLSVGAPFPLSKTSKSNWRVSMFELSSDGWLVDRIRDGSNLKMKLLTYSMVFFFLSITRGENEMVNSGSDASQPPENSKNVGDSKSQISCLVDTIVDIVKTDITTAIRQEYRQTLAETVNKLTASIKDLQHKYDQVKIPRWPPGSYCILANGNCPSGFKQAYGYLRAIMQYAVNPTYIKQATFGSSKIQCHGSCGQWGAYSELHLVTCCK